MHNFRFRAERLNCQGPAPGRALWQQPLRKEQAKAQGSKLDLVELKRLWEARGLLAAAAEASKETAAKALGQEDSPSSASAA